MTETESQIYKKRQQGLWLELTPEERKIVSQKKFYSVYPQWRRDYLDNRKDRPMVHERAFWPVDTSDGRLKQKDRPDIDTALRGIDPYTGQETY
ncbi:hypothetical protein, partial [Klebsiella variicola]